MVLSWATVASRVEEQGWQLVEKDYMGRPNKYLAVCKEKHRFVGEKKNSSYVTPCSYCAGIKTTPEMLMRYAHSRGFKIGAAFSKLVEDSMADNSGNRFVPKDRRLTFICEEGHKQMMSVVEFYKGKECTACKGTRAHTAYSRSEEIIAGVLDHLGIKYIRQAVTDTLHEQLKLDFILPEHKVIIEYDGAHHKYGRTSDGATTLEEIQRTDKVRDAYAEAIGFKMVRITHYNVGKKLVYKLAEVFPAWGINVLDPYYDTLVKNIFDYAHDQFGWDSYDKIKTYADLNLQLGREKAHEQTGRSMSRLQLDYSTIYGKKRKNN